jgi:hypothetical protein
LSASSDFEEKLVTNWSSGTGIVATGRPHGVSSSRNAGEVTPKNASTLSLLKTNGKLSPSATAVPQLPVGAVAQPGGSWVTPAVISAGA